MKQKQEVMYVEAIVGFGAELDIRQQVEAGDLRENPPGDAQHAPYII